MWWPILYDDHVTSQKTSGICPAPRVGLAPEHDSSFCVVWVSQNFVEQDSEAVEMPNVQWPKVCMEAIVEQVIVDSEVEWRVYFGT